VPAIGAALLAGCGGSHHKATAAPQPFDAKRTVDAFLYAPARPAQVCPQLWVASAQPACARLLAKLKRSRRQHVFAPPKRGTIMYRLGGVEGDRVLIEAGDRQPNPSKGPPGFYGAFELQRVGGGWKILQEQP